MNNSEYVNNVLKTEHINIDEVSARFNTVSEYLSDLLYQHSKLTKDIDNVKKYIFYGKQSVYTKHFNSTHLEVDKEKLRLLHSALGVLTESQEVSELIETMVYDGELLDAEKKAYLVQELGDITWYIAVAVNVLEIEFETLFDANIKKLLDKTHGRYKSGTFNSESAINKSTESEMGLIKDMLNK